MIDEERFVAALYKALLSRDPDEAGFSAHLAALKQGKPPERLAREFLLSAEFRSKLSRLISLCPLDRAPPMQVELDLTADQSRVLWGHVTQTWASLGASEPYWSVLAEPQWKASQVAQAKNLETFYATGRNNLERLDFWFARSGVAPSATAICAEYGCGVGRCTIWLARRYARVVAFDISEPHIRLARARAAAEGIDNIEFVQVAAEADLARLSGIDFFYSTIVLQHNPPPLILSILRHVFTGLNPEGIAYFQVPTYSLGYTFRLQEYLGRLVDRGMEMHFVPQCVIFDLAAAHGMRPLEVSPDGMIGNFGRWISTSFLMRKQHCPARPLQPQPASA
jgi:SAM-dependent methyltransferase